MAKVQDGRPMAGRTVLVTGGTTGIGKATALGLAAMGAHLAITGRDQARAEHAARDIRTAGGGQVDVFVADLSAQSQVRRLAAEALQRLPRIDFDDLQGERSYSGARAYNQSKLANVLFTYQLARRLGTTGVTANALHPGVVNTSFGAEDPGVVQRLFVPFLRPFMKSPARGAATSIHVASAAGLDQVTGQYFAGRKPQRSAERSYDEATATRLWQVSTDLVGITAPG